MCGLQSVPVLFFGTKKQRDQGNLQHNPDKTICINIFSPAATLAYARKKIAQGQGFALATLNLDHVVKLRTNTRFFEAYRAHDVVVADGFPIVWLGRLAGAKIEWTTGSDLVLPLLKILEEEKKTLALLGTTDTVLAEASAKIKAMFPDLAIAFSHAPPFGFEPESDQAKTIMQQIESSGAALCLLAFGAPKQEILASVGKVFAPHVGFVSIGASIDFIAGHQIRAPRWIQKINMEWMWRLALNPRRLFWRYAQCALVFPVLLARGFLSKNGGLPASQEQL